jgi:hypothetical protein
MTSTDRIALTCQQFDAIAWGFLGSEFTRRDYANWSIDRRIDAYLLHHGLTHMINDGFGLDRLTEQVMAMVGHARRNGLLGYAQGRPVK